MSLVEGAPSYGFDALPQGAALPPPTYDLPTRPVFPEFPEIGVVPFTRETLREAEETLLTDEIFEGREEVRGIAIDPVGSLDRDDAIYLEEDGYGFIAHVSISDVSAVVKRGSLVDRTAGERVFTRYYGPYGNDPMLPSVLADDRLSLHEGQKRPAITVSLPIGRGLSFGDPVIRRTFLAKGRGLTYPEADEIMKWGEDPDSDMLRSAHRLAIRMAQSRGTYYDLEQAVEFSEERDARVMRWGEAYLSMVTVREFMIRANMAFAQYAKANELPFLYRAHDDLDQRSYYTTSSSRGHAGLGFDSSVPYAHVTSPARRDVDKTNHRLLFEGGYSTEELEEVAESINRSVNAYRDIADGTMAGYMKEMANRAARNALREGGDLTKVEARRLMKVAVQDGLLSDLRLREFLFSSLESGKFAKELVPLLFTAKGDKVTCSLIEEILVKYPGLSKEALDAFCGEKGLPIPNLDWNGATNEDRDNHATLSLKVEDRVISSHKTSAKSKVDAKRLATGDLIKKLRNNPQFRRYLE